MSIQVEDLESNDECMICSGPIEILGILGREVKGRCRNCFVLQSRPINEDEIERAKERERDEAINRPTESRNEGN